MTSIPTRAGRVTLAFLVASTLLGATSQANADPLDCDASVHDPGGLLDREVLDPVVRTVSAQLDADVRVRVEGTLDEGLDRRIAQLVEQCPGWQDDDTEELADDMVIVSFSTVERENSIFYGADLGPELEGRWDAATDAMIPRLQASDYTDAVVAALRELTRDPIGSTIDDASEGDGVPGQVIFWGIVLAAIVVLGYVARQQGWTSGGGGSWDGDDDGGSTGWFGGGRRRSSFRSFGSFGFRSRSSGGSSRRSGGGSRRAGGGSKKW